MTVVQNRIIKNRSLRDDYALGKYSLSFLEIFINSDKISLSQFSIADIKVLFHEYIHFLQDISTYYGVYNAALVLQEIALIFRYASSCTSEIQLKRFKATPKYEKQFDNHKALDHHVFV